MNNLSMSSAKGKGKGKGKSQSNYTNSPAGSQKEANDKKVDVDNLKKPAANKPVEKADT